MIMRGAAPDKAIKAIAKRFHVSKSQAGRLVMTEAAAFANAARKDCFTNLGVERYVIVETLDGETCSLCGQLDGKVYPMSDYQVGVTAPPFHPWCRGTTAPYFEDLEGIGDRAARDGDGKVYDVPRDIKFPIWKEKYVTKPEELRYNIFKIAVHEEIQKSYSLTVNTGMQNKHIRGTNHFDPTRSELTADPVELIKLYAGKSEPIMPASGIWNQKERFTHTSEIGIWRDRATGGSVPTKKVCSTTRKSAVFILYQQSRNKEIVVMNILEKNKELFGQRVKVACADGTTVLGLWNEWWDEEDNSYLADDGLPVCDSILVDSEDVPVEILITEIEAIQKAP